MHDLLFERLEEAGGQNHEKDTHQPRHAGTEREKEMIVIEEKTISEAWFKLFRACVTQGRWYIIERGSYEGAQRAQIDRLALIISCPETRPLAVTYKGMPISDDRSTLEYYQNYIMGCQSRATNEEYTYAERVAPWITGIAEMLRLTPHTNQATLSVGKPGDSELPDPPCLRELSWKVITGGKLQLTSFWRSWDAYGGFPTNMGALQLLNEDVAASAGLETGPLVAFSDGAHVYEHSWGMESFEL